MKLTARCLLTFGRGRGAESVRAGETFDSVEVGWTDLDVAMACERKMVEPVPVSEPAVVIEPEPPKRTRRSKPEPVAEDG